MFGSGTQASRDADAHNMTRAYKILVKTRIAAATKVPVVAKTSTNPYALPASLQLSEGFTLSQIENQVHVVIYWFSYCSTLGHEDCSLDALASTSFSTLCVKDENELLRCWFLSEFGE